MSVHVVFGNWTLGKTYLVCYPQVILKPDVRSTGAGIKCVYCIKNEIAFGDWTPGRLVHSLLVDGTGRRPVDWYRN